MPAPVTFCAVLEPGGPSCTPTQTVVVPAAVLGVLGGKAVKRVICTVQGHPLRLGLLPLPSGGRYLMLNKDVCRAESAYPFSTMPTALSGPSPKNWSFL